MIGHTYSRKADDDDDKKTVKDYEDEEKNDGAEAPLTDVRVYNKHKRDTTVIKITLLQESKVQT